MNMNSYLVSVWVRSVSSWKYLWSISQFSAEVLLKNNCCRSSVYYCHDYFRLVCVCVYAAVPLYAGGDGDGGGVC